MTIQVTIEAMAAHRKLRRRVWGIAAGLLPFDANGRIAVEAFQQHLRATHSAGLTNAVNMDTGYVNYLSEDEKRDVLRWAREALGPGVPFVAGAYIEGLEGDTVALYRQQIENITRHDGTPILFQTARLKGKPGTALAGTYQEVCRGYQGVIAFELGPMFAPNGEILTPDTVARVMDIPEIIGIKHSSLDRVTEFGRLQLRDQHRPEFRIFTGNDLAIDMIEYGSDYLLGLATFAPEKFAERDHLWETGDCAYYALNDALQYLGNVAFRDPVPAYKHSAAVFLHLTGRIPADEPHSRNPRRPLWEHEMLQDCARRLFGNRLTP